MAAPPDPTSERPVLGYVDASTRQVTPLTTLTAVVALVVLVCVMAGLALVALEVIDSYRAARLTNQRSLDRALVILARPRTYQRPEFAGRWWLVFAITACAAWATALAWTGIAAQRVLRVGHFAMPSLRLRAWGAAAVAVVSATVVLAFAAHIRRVFRDWDMLGDFLYRDTSLMIFSTALTASMCFFLALWVDHRHRRISAQMPHSAL